MFIREKILNIIRKEREKLGRKNDILKASEIVFAKKGFHKATMNDIAKESRYAVGTIYIYFKNKNDLYFTLMKSKFHRMTEGVKGAVENANPQNKIKALIKFQLESFQSDKDFFKILFSDVRSTENATREKFTKEHISAFIKHIKYIASIVELSRKSGYVRKDVDSLRAAYLIAAMMNASVFYWISDKKQTISLNDQVDFVYDMVLNGIGK